MTFQIREASLDEIDQVQAGIREFTVPYSKGKIFERIKGKTFLGLVAHNERELLGFKLGYAESKTAFYSWLGGVKPQARRQGVARRLLHHQERWAADHGFETLRVKSRNRFRAMMILLLSEGYEITGTDIDVHSEDSAIHFLKRL